MCICTYSVSQKYTSSVLTESIVNTVEPPSKGHFGANSFVPCIGVVPISEGPLLEVPLYTYKGKCAIRALGGPTLLQGTRWPHFAGQQVSSPLCRDASGEGPILQEVHIDRVGVGPR